MREHIYTENIAYKLVGIENHYEKKTLYNFLVTEFHSA